MYKDTAGLEELMTLSLLFVTVSSLKTTKHNEKHSNDTHSTKNTMKNIPNHCVITTVYQT